MEVPPEVGHRRAPCRRGGGLRHHVTLLNPAGQHDRVHHGARRENHLSQIRGSMSMDVGKEVGVEVREVVVAIPAGGVAS